MPDRQLRLHNVGSNMSLWVDLQTVGAAWASAVATAAATGTALWLALSERRQRLIERDRAVKLIASGVAVYLEEIRLELITALASIEKGLSMGNPALLAEFLSTVADHVRTLNTAVLAGQELNVLAALPENAGEKIYTALSCIRSVQDGLSRRLDIVTGGNPEAGVMVEHWRNQLSWARGLVEEGQAVCARYGTLRVVQIKG